MQTQTTSKTSIAAASKILNGLSNKKFQAMNQDEAGKLVENIGADRLYDLLSKKKRAFFVTIITGNDCKPGISKEGFVKRVSPKIEVKEKDMSKQNTKQEASKQQPQTVSIEDALKALGIDSDSDLAKAIQSVGKSEPQAEEPQEAKEEEKAEEKVEAKIDPIGKLLSLFGLKRAEDAAESKAESEAKAEDKPEDEKSDLDKAIEGMLELAQKATDKKVKAVAVLTEKDGKSVKEILAFDNLVKMTEQEALCVLFGIKEDHDVFLMDPIKVIKGGAPLAKSLADKCKEHGLSKSQGHFFKVFLYTKLSGARYMIRRANPHVLKDREDASWFDRSMFKCETTLSAATNWLASWWNSDLS